MNYLLDLFELVVSKLKGHRIHDAYKISVFGFTFGFEPIFLFVFACSSLFEPAPAGENVECSQRDLNPCSGVESPMSLAVLDDRSACAHCILASAIHMIMTA